MDALLDYFALSVSFVGPDGGAVHPRRLNELRPGAYDSQYFDSSKGHSK
ncbi:hypothetical protein D1AOALGA4SA_11000 [Olavius algarvensis Delta 1 endosymbiont]|nr:hypothetical protein D1AOALGA4SA_11000 [Olavius algarvensis Delta 1 endosymbiont]